MWEERYSGAGGYLFGTQAAAALVENPWVLDGMRSALCVADGEGRNSVHLARAGLDVTAFDLSPTAVGRARDLAAEAGVSLDLNVSRWDDWDFSRQFDLVVGVFVQFMGPEARKAQFADLRRAVRPGGRLFLHGYRPRQVDYGTGGPPDAANMYTEDLLRDAFGDWRIERLAEYDRDVQEGRGHSGMSALIDLVVQRPEQGA